MRIGVLLLTGVLAACAFSERKQTTEPSPSPWVAVTPQPLSNQPLGRCRLSERPSRWKLQCEHSAVEREVTLGKVNAIEWSDAIYWPLDFPSVRGSRGELVALSRNPTDKVSSLVKGGSFHFFRRGPELAVIEYHSCGCADSCWVATRFDLMAGEAKRQGSIECSCDESCNQPYLVDKLNTIASQLLR